MSRVAVVGSLNVDFVVRVPRRPGEGETVIGTSFDTFVGGKGCNQALAAARAGAEVAMIGRIGADPFGDIIVGKLVEAGVDCHHLIRDAEAGTGIADIQIDDRGQNCIAIVPRANARLSAGDVEAAAASIAGAAVVLLQLEIPLATAVAAARVGRAAGATVVLNPAPAPASGALPPALLEHVDILVPNQSEAGLLTGHPTRDPAGALAAARALQTLGVPRVIVTIGEQGALLVDGDAAPATVPPFAVEVCDTTAAGDAFCGALAAALAAGETLGRSVIWACAGGALACTRLGAEPSLPPRAEIERLVATRG